jgi:hypothetical protein
VFAAYSDAANHLPPYKTKCREADNSRHFCLIAHESNDQGCQSLHLATHHRIGFVEPDHVPLRIAEQAEPASVWDVGFFDKDRPTSLLNSL